MNGTPTLPQSLLASGALVAILALMTWAGSAAWRSRDEADRIRAWVVRLWGCGAVAWLLSALAIRSWRGDMWTALDLVKAGEMPQSAFALGAVSAVGAIAALFGVTSTWKIASAGGFARSEEPLPPSGEQERAIAREPDEAPSEEEGAR